MRGEGVALGLGQVGLRDGRLWGWRGNRKGRWKRKKSTQGRKTAEGRDIPKDKLRMRNFEVGGAWQFFGRMLPT